MDETWVSPATIGAEAQSTRGSVWRFRALAVAALLLLILAAAYAIYRIQGNGGGT